MMDTQRLIALVVFSFSALMLWDAWQKHEAAHAPKLPGEHGARRFRAHADGTAPKVPSATAGRDCPAPAPAIASPTAGPVAPLGQTVTVKTDLFDVEINTQGGDIRRVTMKKQHSALDRTQASHADGARPAALFRHADRGCWARACPITRAPTRPSRLSYTLADGNDSVVVRLKAHSADGIEVTKTFTFKRDSYVVDVAYEVANRTDKPISPFAYFQFLRDSNPPAQRGRAHEPPSAA